MRDLTQPLKEQNNLLEHIKNSLVYIKEDSNGYQLIWEKYVVYKANTLKDIVKAFYSIMIESDNE